MTFDRATIAPAAQKHYADIGSGYGSDDTLRQADKTLTAIIKHAPLLADHGFLAGNTELLTDLREALLGAGVTRDSTRAGKKITNAAHLDAMDHAKTLRFKLRSIFSNAHTALFNQGEKASVNDIDVALSATSSAGADSELLGRQLETLVGLLANTAIRQAVGGGDETVAAAIETEVTDKLAALKSTREQKAGPRGTPAETEYLDLLDGMIVVLCRNARKAGRALARASGQPAIAKEFSLGELYRTRKRRTSEDDTDPVPA